MIVLSTLQYEREADSHILYFVGLFEDNIKSESYQADQSYCSLYGSMEAFCHFQQQVKSFLSSRPRASSERPMLHRSKMTQKKYDSIPKQLLCFRFPRGNYMIHRMFSESILQEKKQALLCVLCSMTNDRVVNLNSSVVLLYSTVEGLDKTRALKGRCPCFPTPLFPAKPYPTFLPSYSSQLPTVHSLLIC